MLRNDNTKQGKQGVNHERFQSKRLKRHRNKHLSGLRGQGDASSPDNITAWQTVCVRYVLAIVTSCTVLAREYYIFCKLSGADIYDNQPTQPKECTQIRYSISTA